MKKLFLSAALVVAFSLTSFATEKNISETAIDFETSSSLSTLADSNIVEGQIVEGCETSTIRWASGESDGHGGTVLKFHHATLVTCDDGFAAIVD
jgi:hypothetical protein